MCYQKRVILAFCSEISDLINRGEWSKLHITWSTGSAELGTGLAGKAEDSESSVTSSEIGSSRDLSQGVAHICE